MVGLAGTPKLTGPRREFSLLRQAVIGRAAGHILVYIEGMTLEAIKEAIAGLPRNEKARLAAWLLRQDAEEWDPQIQEDFSPGGRGMALLDEAKADVRDGQAKPMDQFLAEAKARRNQPTPKP